MVTQAHAGAVDLSLYANGVALRDAGALSGGDMGLEAAVAKLMHALARFPDDARARAPSTSCATSPASAATAACTSPTKRPIAQA